MAFGGAPQEEARTSDLTADPEAGDALSDSRHYHFHTLFVSEVCRPSSFIHSVNDL